MSLTSRRELLASIAPRYCAAKRFDKQRILEEFTAATGYHRQYAIQLLNHPPSLRTGAITRPRARRYDQTVQTTLMQLWELADRICAKRLVPLLPTLIEALEHHGHLLLSASLREQLLAISPATVDRLLREARQRAPGAGTATSRSSGLLKHQIPIRTFADWENHGPGFFEADLVAHCGRYNAGSYLNSLVLTDVVSGWTECAALLVREQSLVVHAVAAIDQRLPIALLGLDTDNGSEFINQSVIDFCRDTQISLTRSRAYQKNDQCFVEQKNGSIVRRWIGYDRYEGLEACTRLAQLYERLRLYLNYFQPSLKLLSKTRTGAKVSKRYDKAQTPCQRLLASPHVEEAAKAMLRAELKRLDPVVLQAEIRSLQDALWALVRSDRLPYRCFPTASATEASAEPPPKPQAVVLPLRRDAEADASRRPAVRQYRRRKTPRAPRTWRTRLDPFAEVWDELQSQLAQTPELTAKALFEYLQRHYPGRFNRGQLRTLHRRVKAWRTQQAVQLLTPQPGQQDATEPLPPVRLSA
jgi:hypothetical protein